MGRALSKIEELSAFGKEVKTFRLFDGKTYDSVFDIGGGCPKVGPVALKRKLLSAYWHEGKCYEFNFSKFWTFTRTKFECRETETQIIWHVEQKNVAQPHGDRHLLREEGYASCEL